jgi:hypothetical protein
MKKIIILLIFLSSIVSANTMTTSSYKNITIGMSPSKALEISKDYAADLQGNPDCYYLYSKTDDADANFMVFEGKVERIDIEYKSANISTVKGIGIGATKKQVLAAYSTVLVSPHPYLSSRGEYLEVKLANGNGIIFETEQDIVTSFRLGSYPAILYIEGCH